MQKTLILAVVFAGLVGVYLATKEEKIVSDELEFKLPAIDTKTVDLVEVGGKNAVTLKRSGESWTLDGGGQAADPDAVKKALEALAELKVQDLVSQNPDKHAELEVDTDKGVTLKVMAGGDKVLNVVLGKWSSDFQKSYLRPAGMDKVFLVSKNLKSLFDKPAKSWRDLALSRFERDDATEITLTGPSGKLRFTRTVGGDAGPGEWELAEPALPEAFKFDPKKVAQLASTLSNLRAQDPVNEAEELQKHAGAPAGADGGVAAPAPSAAEVFGLEPAAHEVTVKTKDGTTTVSLGNNNKDGSAAYAKSSTKKGVFSLSKWSADGLRKGLDDFRDFTLADAKEPDIQEMTLTQGKAVLEFARDGGAWTLKSHKGLTAPKDFELDPNAIKRIAGTFTAFQGDEWVSPQPDAVNAGLDKPTAVFTAKTAGGQDIRIEVGKKDDAKKGYLVRAGQGPVLFAREWRITRFLDKKLEDFAKKKDS